MRFCRRAASAAVAIACLLAFAPVAAFAQSVAPPDVVATRAVIVDGTTGDILLDKGANQPVAMASLTKLFTAFVSIETTPLNRQMDVRQHDLVGEASMGITNGEVLSFQTLLLGMMLPSGNDAATAIARNLGAEVGDTDAQAEQRFIDRANQRLASIGLYNTHLANPHGLDADGHYSTARDIAALTLYALNHEPAFAEAIGTDEYQAEGHAIYNTNRLLGNYAGLVGGKTGVTDNAGYCLMQVAERNGQRVIVVLLGSTPDAWYDDAEALLDYGFDALAAPGATTRFGQITFGTAPAAAVPQSQQATGLQVSELGAGSALVLQTDIAGTPRRSPWLWFITALVIAPVALLTLIQVQRGLGRRPASTGRRRATTRSHNVPQVATPTPRYPAAPIYQQASAVATETEFDWLNVSPDYRFDETTEFRVAAQRPGRATPGDRRQYPTLSPSYGGD